MRWNGQLFDENNNFSEIKNGNGNIKVYNEDSILIFEGEYLNGKKNCKGKEYYINEEFMFKGEYKNDKNQNGKGYDDLNNVIYELMKVNGKVKEYNKRI